MPFRPCVSGCGRYLVPGDGHDRCLLCLGIEHAEAAFVDESCPHCGGMTVAGLRTRLRFLQRGRVPVPLPRSRVPPGGYRGEATSGSSRAGLKVTVRNSPPKTARAPPVTGTSLPMELPRERASPSHGGGVPLVSFGAPPDDRMSIATSEGESDQSGDDGSVPLPPSGRSAVLDSDPEMVAMLARAAESVGLEWRPPPCPEPSRLDDWFLGVYGDCGGGHAAGAAPYETASILDPWPSPEVGVAERHAEGPSHSSLLPNLHPVVRPFIPSGRSAPGTGLQARCGLHRRLRQGLGGHVQRACSVGGLDRSPTALAHTGSTPGLEPSQETLTRRACTSPYGQHCDRCVHQPTRWFTLPSHDTTRPPPPPLESEGSEVASRHSYPGLAQPDSRRAVTSCAPRRMETPSPDGPADLAMFWTRTGRPVRVPRDVALPVVLLPDRWNTRHGRTGTQLAAGP